MGGGLDQALTPGYILSKGVPSPELMLTHLLGPRNWAESALCRVPEEWVSSTLPGLSWWEPKLLPGLVRTFPTRSQQATFETDHYLVQTAPVWVHVTSGTGTGLASEASHSLAKRSALIGDLASRTAVCDLSPRPCSSQGTVRWTGGPITVLCGCSSRHNICPLRLHEEQVLISCRQDLNNSNPLYDPTHQCSWVLASLSELSCGQDRQCNINIVTALSHANLSVVGVLEVIVTDTLFVLCYIGAVTRIFIFRYMGHVMNLMCQYPQSGDLFRLATNKLGLVASLFYEQVVEPRSCLL